jgi:hypothetical protein
MWYPKMKKHLRPALALAILLCAGPLWASETVKAPIPTGTTLADSTRLARSTYKDELLAARKPADKSALAAKILEVGNAEENNPGNKFALLMLAKTTAVEAGDADITFKAIEQLDGFFQIDTLAFKAQAAAELSSTNRSADTVRDFVVRLDGVINEALLADRYDIARQINTLAINTARSSSDLAALKLAAAHTQQVKDIEAAFNELKTVLPTLHDKPTDPDANLKVGRFRCFLKGDWESGTPMLALGSDATLRALAEREFEGPADTDSSVALGDGWWDLSDKEPGITAKAQIRKHAAKWYREVQPQLTGLSKAKVEKRLALIEDVVLAGPPPRNIITPLLDTAQHFRTYWRSKTRDDFYPATRITEVVGRGDLGEVNVDAPWNSIAFECAVDRGPKDLSVTVNDTRLSFKGLADSAAGRFLPVVIAYDKVKKMLTMSISDRVVDQASIEPDDFAQKLRLAFHWNGNFNVDLRLHNLALVTEARKDQ